MKITSREQCEKLISVLYEKCEEGEISIDQRESMVRKARHEFMNNFLTENTNSINDEETDHEGLTMESVKENYEKFKTVVYEKCSEGEITVEQRELLLERARNDLFASLS